jgi:hypothetical protein
VSGLVRKTLLWLAFAALGHTRAAAGSELPIIEVQPGGIQKLAARLVLEVPRAPAELDIARVAVARAAEPLGWFEPVDMGPDGRVFIPRRAVNLPAEPAALRAWFIGSGLIGAAGQEWPIEAELRAEIDAVGLAAHSVWLDAGSDHGVAIGDCWWQRIKGQPVARYEVRVAGRDVCHCRVVSLVAGWRPKVSEVVALWPAPGRQRTGRAVTAVSFVETKGDSQSVWVAAHPGLDAPPEPRLDFHRDGAYVGSGVVERREARFWYVRTLPAAGRDAVRVGDDAVIRTSADIRQRRFTARVFEQTAAGGLINAGEMDGLSVGDVGTVYRDGQQVGRVTLTRVQHDYSVAELAVGGEDAGAARPPPGGEQQPARGPSRLERLDEVRFRPPEEPTRARAVIERVVEDTLFSGRITEAGAVPLHTPLAVRRAGRTIGVAILLDVVDDRALGFALARSLSGSLLPGDELTLSPETDLPATRPAR